MKSKLDDAIKNLSRVRRRLEADQSRMKRRNARRAFIGAMKSVRYAFDTKYPPIEKPGKPKQPPQPKPSTALPFSRAFDVKAARLFLQIVRDKPDNLPGMEAHEGARKPGAKDHPGGDVHNERIYFAPKWSATTKWKQVIEWVARYGPDFSHLRRHDFLRRRAHAIDLWRKFWTEQLPVTDIPLAAEHHRFLEHAARRQDRAARAVAKKTERRKV